MYEIRKIQKSDNISSNYLVDNSSSLNIDNVLDKSNVLMQIASRAADPNAKHIAQLHVFDQESLAKLAEKMPEINRASRAFGRSNSQTSDKLMSLTMISYSPYRYLHQCLAKIESRRAAIKENQYRLRKSQIEIAKLKLEKDELVSKLNNGDPEVIIAKRKLDIQLLDIEIEEKAVSLNDSMLYLEGALKEIAVYQDAYEQIRLSHNIPENWDEKDFELSEIEHHVKSAFNNGIRDILSTGRLNNGTLEYMHQFGINPITAQTIIGSYIEDAMDMIRKNNTYPTIAHLEDFLNKAYDVFKDAYKENLSKIGLNDILTNGGLFLDNNKFT